MKKNHPTFYVANEGKLLLNKSAYEHIAPSIESAVVSFYNDIAVVEKTCEYLQEEHVYIVNGKEVSKKEMCFQCIHRLKMATGGKCEGFQPIRGEQHHDFFYLMKILEEKNAQVDNELACYYDMYTSSYEDKENEMGEMTYREYNKLVLFTSKLNDAFEMWHRMSGFFSKCLR